ncbi:LamG domain-containing protein [bacterium]|nr:LamG domain-containing protein [bacterium]
MKLTGLLHLAMAKPQPLVVAVFAAVLACLSARTALALTWTRPNEANPLTVALYHFNETGGTIATNDAGGLAGALTLEDASMRRSAASGWMPGSLRFISTSNDLVASSFLLNSAVDWQADDLTVSFWFRNTKAPASNPDAGAAYGGPWGARCAFDWQADALIPLAPMFRRIAIPVAGVGTNAVLDGAWHHCGMAYSGADGRVRVYIDNDLKTNNAVSAGETNSPLTALSIGGGPFAPVLSADDIDELLIEKSFITDFSDGHVIPEPACAILILPLLLRAIRRRRV